MVNPPGFLGMLLTSINRQRALLTRPTTRCSKTSPVMMRIYWRRSQIKDVPIPVRLWLVVWNINFIFPYIGNNHPNWLSYFSEGFKPPTRCFCWAWNNLWEPWIFRGFAWFSKGRNYKTPKNHQKVQGKTMAEIVCMTHATLEEGIFTDFPIGLTRFD